jgi:GT2 family glycosyltransferase
MVIKKIATLLTCHNRKEKTIACLNALHLNILPEGYTFDVYLVDDGSTDGTADAVKEHFSQVNVITGDGTLYWNRGMYTAWKVAAKTFEYDFYLWLNDDTLLFQNGIKTVIEAAEQTNFSSIICGATCSEKEGIVTYGAIKNKTEGLLVPNGRIQECRIINGNFLLVPKQVYEKLGNLDWIFNHAIGDFDYGLRAIKAGFKNFLAKEFVGTCESNPTLPKWCLKETPLLKRFKLLYSPLGYAEPIPFFKYEKRHFGLSTAIKHFITINIRALIPQLWK